MGTRGLTGVVIDGQEKLAYQQYDSYPEGVGIEVLTYLRVTMEAEALPRLRQQARDLKVVDDSTPPTQDDIEALAKYTNLGVSTQSTSDWYCLLREAQGKLDLILESGYCRDSHEFARDSLFCEWAYVADLDTETLEVYRGFQTSPPAQGRFKDRPPEDRESMGEKYYPIALLHSWPLADLPDEETFTKTLRKKLGEQE